MGWPRGVVEADAGLGALLGEIPAAERGYDGECCAGMTEKAPWGDGDGRVGWWRLLRDAQGDFLGAGGGQIQLHDAVVVGVGDD